MRAATLRLVRDRAGSACEYCGLPQDATPFVTFHAEHVVARQHGGEDDPDNLALACDRCNAYKGPNLVTVDPESGGIVALFHPRRDTWTDHFTVEDGTIVGHTPTGVATARLLNMNDPKRIELRRQYLEIEEADDA
jgi:hypothetical protein